VLENDTVSFDSRREIFAEGKAPNFYLQPDDIVCVRQTTLRGTLLYTYDIVTKMFPFTGRLFTL
jgi:hypothetical protein